MANQNLSDVRYVTIENLRYYHQLLMNYIESRATSVDEIISIIGNFDDDSFFVRYYDNYKAGQKTNLVQKNSTIYIAENPFDRALYNFKYWTTVNDGTGDIYHPGDTKVINDNFTLFAQWYNKQPEMVDLGLSVTWAKYNYGVDPNNLTTKEKWFGNYYAWGEFALKNDYSWQRYLRYSDGLFNNDTHKNSFTKYIPSTKPEYWGSTGDPDNLIELEHDDDLLFTTYGGNFRLPTYSECRELLESNQIDKTWVTNYKGINGLNGMVFTSHIAGYDGNNIFIPMANYFIGASLENNDSCRIWCSKINDLNPQNAYHLRLKERDQYMDAFDRCRGLPIRCICKKVNTD